MLERVAKLTPVLALVVALVGYLDTHSLHPFFALYAASLGASVAVVGVIVAAYSLFEDLFEVPLGYVMDRVGRRKFFLSAGLAIDAASMLLYSLCRTDYQLLLFRVLHGLGGAFMGPAMMSLMAEIRYPLAGMGSRMGMYGLPIAVAATLGWVLGGLAVWRVGYTLFFQVFALVLAAAALLALLISEPDPPRRGRLSAREVFSELKLLLTKSSYVAAAYAILAYTATLGAVVTLLPLRAHELGLTSMHVGVALASFGVSWAAAQAPMGVLSDRIGRKAQLVLGLAVVALSLTALGFASSFPAMALSMSVYGVGASMIFPSAAALSLESAGAGRRALASGFFHVLYTEGVVLGAVAFAYAASRLGNPAGLQLSAAMPASAILLALVFRWTATQPPANTGGPNPSPEMHS